MEWDVDQRAPGIWCIAARTVKHPPADDRKGGYAQFGPNITVYCLPPNRNDVEAEVRAVGYSGRLHRLVHGTLLVNHLKHWHPEYVTDPRLAESLGPPWDAKDESRAVASLVCAWQEGGDWPGVELRDWNRTRAQRTVGHGGFIKRLMHRFFSVKKTEKRRQA